MFESLFKWAEINFVELIEYDCYVSLLKKSFQAVLNSINFYNLRKGDFDLGLKFDRIYKIMHHIFIKNTFIISELFRSMGSVKNQKA